MRGIEGEPIMRERAVIKPVGLLAELLERYNAPPEAQRSIARRAGTVFGKGLNPTHVERAIQDSMQHGGLPNWGHVEERVRARVRDVYRSMRRSP